MKYLVVVDMQNDFIDGALGTKEAVGIVENVQKKVEAFEGKLIYTRDTHFENYLKTQEGKNLPVKHCIKDSFGWQIRNEVFKTPEKIFDKLTFGCDELGRFFKEENEKEPIESIEFVGLCTDICVISNVMLTKAFVPEVPLIVDGSCCAGVSPETHENALKAMAVCQVKVI